MKSYVIPCPSPFRDAVMDLAARRGLTATDLALGILTVIDPGTIDVIDDPGDPAPGDRVIVPLKSGPRKGKTLKRKPRLQMRLPTGLEHARIRQALALALAIDQGKRSVSVIASDQQSSHERELAAHHEALARAEQALAEMRATLNIIAFDANSQSVSSTAQASYILGFPPGTLLTRDLIKSRFRQLSRVFHPDRPTGDSARMSRLIEAVRFLESRLPKRFEFKPVHGS